MASVFVVGHSKIFVCASPN